MADRAEHPSAPELERFAEGISDPGESASLATHVARCGACAAEVESYRRLFSALDDLARFAPSDGFADAVMTRVAIAPQESTVVAWLREHAPTTTAGWALLAAALVAPILPLIAVVAWLLTQPLPSAEVAWQWLRLSGWATVTSSFDLLLDRAVRLGIPGWIEAGYASVQSIPTAALAAVIGLLAIAMPLSAWSLVRLTRTPVGKVSYAN